MHTIDAFQEEIFRQIEFVQNFKPKKPIAKKKLKKAIFCGTGDSFAASQLAEIFSCQRARAYDPLDLLKNRKLLEGRDVYLVSVSGNTISNIKLARMHRDTIAITANYKSRLARACRDMIPLKFDSTGIQTAGSISFLASTLTCISLVTSYKIKDVHKQWIKAERDARRISLRGKVYVLGTMHTMPVAMFCTAKLYEVLGTDAHYERIEQFSHMGLFSARKGDTVLIFEQRNEHNVILVKNLKKCGLVAIRIEPPTGNLQEQILFFTFFSELIALYGARKKKKTDCFFIEENGLRNVSSSMIY